MYSQQSKDIKKQLALKYNLTQEQIQEILQIYYDHLVNIVSDSDKEVLLFYNKRVPNFGIFGVKEGRKKHLSYEKKTNLRSRKVE